MSGNSFGKVFRITTFGESHGPAVGVVIDGCPPSLEISADEIQQELDRRRPGQNKLTTARQEKDKVQILSGYFEGKTTGAPLTLMVENHDQRSKDYSEIKDVYRPSHADYTYSVKYGNRDWRGGGRSSARETLARVAAGAIAKKFLQKYNIEFICYTEQIGEYKINKGQINDEDINLTDIEKSPVRCPDVSVSKKIEDYILQLKKDGDSVGGIVRGIIKGVPIGLGEPVFDKLQADLAKAMLSINAAKGFEYGEGLDSVVMKGSEHNDEFTLENSEITTNSNHAGGILGGISNGNPINFRVAFKPTATILKNQNTLTKDKEAIQIKVKGRHDPCVVPRAVPVVEAMASLVIMDHFLRYQKI